MAWASSFAVGSVVAQLFGQSYLSLLLTGLAAVFATGALWFTIGKVADITQETRTRFAWYAIAILTVLTAMRIPRRALLLRYWRRCRVHASASRRPSTDRHIRVLPIRRSLLQNPDLDWSRIPGYSR